MENELQHHGIKGMKWGIRRFQRKDGTLTTLGKRRADKKVQKEKEKEELDRAKSEQKARLKSVRKMTSDEINERIKRMQLEKEYKQLLKDTSGVTAGQKFVTDVLEKAGKDLLVQTTAYVGGNLINKLLFNGEKAIDPKNIQNRSKK